MNEPVGLTDLLRRGLESKPDVDAVVSRDKRWTWRSLDRASSRLAASYLSLGLRRGDRIASLMPNRCVLLVHYLACMKAGLVGVPLNYRYMPPEIDHALGVSQASAMLVHAERDTDIAACEHAANLPLGLIRYRSTDEAGLDLEDLIEGGTGTEETPTIRPTEPAFIFFTSGSTGPAKGVTHTPESLAWMFASCAQGFELTSSDILLPASSISHIGGFLFSFAALSRGGRVLVARTTVADEVLPLLRGEKPTVLCMVPAALFRVVRDSTATREDFASLRLLRSGSDKVPMELEREFKDLAGLPIDEGYGMTEVGLATLHPPSGPIVPGSVGRPLPGFSMSIRSNNGQELPAGAEGNLWIKTRSRMAGYWRDERATRAILRDDWLDSGDVMVADPAGNLWFHGRKKQIIVHDGSNICPQEVEDALLEHPAVASAGVVGVHDALHGENVRAYVTFRSGAGHPAELELIQFARERIGYKAPEHVDVLAEMPLNPTGKVDRVTLKRMAADHHGGIALE